MDSSEANLDRIEAQRPTDVSHDQRKGRCFLNCFLKTGGGENTPPTTRETESVPEFLTNLKFSDLCQLPDESVQMNPEIFTAVSAGKKECLEKLRSHGTPMPYFKNDRGDSVLHLAAAWGHLELVKSIVSECPYLLLEPNSKDQLPLHVAAHGGHLTVVEALVATVTFISDKLSDEEEKKRLNIYVLKDQNGDTPLHATFKGSTFKGHHMESALCLVKADKRASFLANKDELSPLFLAVEAGNVTLVKAMLKATENDGLEGRNSTLEFELEGRRVLVHAALMAKSTDIIDVILKEDPSLEEERDKEGRTCLSFGAYIGYYKGIRNLLDRSTKSVYICNDDGSFPIHMAAKNGHVKIVEEFLERCPDSEHLLNKLGQNILHIAVSSGKLSLVLRLRSLYRTQYMSDEQDVDGNTPLHLATIKWRHRVIFLLIGISKENSMCIRNNCGLTPLDIAESTLQPNYIFQERLALLVIVFLYALRDRTMRTKKLTRPSKPLDREKNKEYINALILVATLVATVTFAAGFTIPGGFKSSAPNLGRAILASDNALSFFVVFNTLAMQSSVIALSALIWAQLGDPAIVHRSLKLALPLLFFALFCMSMAFFSGMLTMVGNVAGLDYFLRFSFVVFLFGMLFILGPHVILQIPGISPAFGIYFMNFMVYPEDDDEKDQTSSSHTSKITGKSDLEKRGRT